MQQKSRKIYVLSGLGVDHRVFADIDFGDFEVVHIPWLQPIRAETISAYAIRIAALIIESNPIIIGLSFGGIVAQEIARIIPCEKIILIASAKSRSELPRVYYLIGRIGIHKLVPDFLLNRSGKFTKWLFGIHQVQHKQLLSVILKETNPRFRNWAIDALLKWNQNQPQNNTISIHGDKDRLLPIRNVQTDFIIPGAGHFLTVTHANAVNGLLKKILK